MGPIRESWGSRVNSQIFEFLVLSESTLYGGSKMGSITPQVQAVDFLWRPKVGWSGQKWTKMTKNGFLGDFLP